MVERDIVIAGAGPVGLTAALAVRATGRPVTVVEAGRPTVFARQGSGRMLHNGMIL